VSAGRWESSGRNSKRDTTVESHPSRKRMVDHRRVLRKDEETGKRDEAPGPNPNLGSLSHFGIHGRAVC